jgi:predicted RNase H-like HicB family nuclease
MRDDHISEEDGGYIADIPDLDSCSAFGETPEQALEEVEKAKQARIDAAHRLGSLFPVPATAP